MRELTYLSLFSGIGSPEMALRDLGINYKLIGFSEIDKKAIKSYCSIHGVDESLNLGDITKIKIETLPRNIDLITHGSPCQDFSVSGFKLGGDEGSGTRSSLMWNTVEIVKHSNPKVVIWENVKGVLHKQHIHNFNKYIERMESLGYINYYEVINSKYFGVAQNRERIFVISIKKDVVENNDKKFVFPKGTDKLVPLKNVLDKEVPQRFYIKKVENPRETKNYIQYDNSGKGYNSQTDRLYYLEGQMCTILKGDNGSKAKVLLDKETLTGRRITPREAWKLMGFSESDFIKAENSGGQTLGSLYGQAGNSIVLPVIKGIIKNLPIC